MSDPRRNYGPSQAGQSPSRPTHGAYATPSVMPRKDLQEVQYGQSYPVAGPPSTYDNSFRNRAFHHPADVPPPKPPPHANAPLPPTDNSNVGQGLHYSQSMRTNSTVTPGMDNLGPAAAGGGISGIALGVANTHERQSGLDAIQSMDVSRDGTFLPRAQPAYHTSGGAGHTYAPTAAPPPTTTPDYRHAEPLGLSRGSYASDMMMGGAGSHAGHLTPGQSTPRLAASNTSERDLLDPYYIAHPSSGPPSQRGPYQRDSVYSYSVDPFDINPDEIIDDGDDEFEHRPQRTSAHGVPAATAASGAAPGILGTLGGMVRGSRTFETGGGPSYGPVPGPGLESGEKRSVLRRAGNGRRRKGGWIVGLILAVVIIAAIVGGVVGGIFGHRGHGGNNTASGDTAANGDLGLNSPEIQALLNDPKLHKVFPGMDYTPWGTQYPLCLTYPPSQNNVTRDLAVLSQLTNNVRLYGTDCNQTEMVLHAIDRLQLKDMKVWLGVWIDSNTTTNERQLNQLYKVIDGTSDKSIFNGAIIGNEALFRAGPDIATAETNLIAYLTSVKANFTQRGLQHLPVATSDLGDNWNAQLVQAADVVMSNVHPFFAGVNVDIAASWTWTFWQQHDVALTQGTSKKQIISEVGWPSGGGNDCGTNNVCPDATAGSVAGIDQMNKFLSEWVCQALDNGTDYFWFEAFDEPWKVIYNTPGKSWEDKWGLMDAGRNLKAGLTIPDCGGKTAT